MLLGRYAENFAKGNFRYFKKRGAQLQAVSGGALEDNIKISLVILRGGARLTQGGCKIHPCVKIKTLLLF